MEYQGSAVQLKKCKATCSKAKKTTTVAGLVIKSDSSGNIFTITMTVKKGATKGIFKKVDLELVVTTSTTTRAITTTTTMTTTATSNYIVMLCCHISYVFS